jgi:integrase/recombinase XerD
VDKKIKSDLTKLKENKKGIAESYLACISAQSYSIHTVKNRKWILEEFLKDFDIPDRNSVSRFIQQGHWSKNSEAQIVYALKAFGKWIIKEYDINFDIPSSIKQPKKHLVYLSKDEVVKLRNACKKIRDKAIIDMFLLTGLKLSELHILNIDDLNLKMDTISLTEKGGKKRVLSIDKILKNTLQSYLQWREVHTQGSALFISKKGTRLSKMEIYTTVKRRAKNAGINKNISPHTLRHTFAALLSQILHY